MAVYPIPNQALDLSTSDSIYCNRLGERYYQIMSRDGCSEVEVSLGEETDIELFRNPNFVNLNVDPAGWVWDLANVTNNQVVLIPTGSIEQVVPTETGKYYRVCVDIKEIAPTQALCFLPQNAIIASGQNCVSTAGVHCFYFYGIATAERIMFAATGATGNITIDSASIKEITIPTVQIRTCADVVVGVSPTVEIYKQIAKITYCWIGLQEGCYKMCVSPVPETGFDILSGANLITTQGGRAIALEALTSTRLTGLDRATLTWIP